MIQGLVIADVARWNTARAWGTLSGLKEQPEQEIRAHIRSTSSDSTHHFVVDSTNYFVDHGARLLAALRVGIGLSPGLSPDRNAYLVEASSRGSLTPDCREEA